jgi:hypothetical protein
MIQPSKYNQIFTLFAVLILTNNNLRECCYRVKRHCWGGVSCGLAKQGGRTSTPTKIWRIQFLRSNFTYTYRHDVMQYKLTKFYTGFRLIVVSLDKNVYARVDDRLNIFRAFSLAANIEFDYGILYRQHRFI